MYFIILWNGLFNFVDNKKHVNCLNYLCLCFEYYSGCGWTKLFTKSNNPR
jgi:hypothetical protein